MNDVPLAITEFNSIAADRPTPFTFNHVGALYLADMLGRLAHAGADMVVHWELYDQPTTAKNGTSYGLISHHGSTLTIPPGMRKAELKDKFAPMPVYYTHLLYAQLFGDELVPATSSEQGRLTIWASRRKGEPNTLRLIIVNLAAKPAQATLRFRDFTPATGQVYRMEDPEFATAADMESVRRNTKINGLTIKATTAAQIEASAAAILESGTPFDPNARSHDFPPWSVTSLVLTGSK